jgi:anti-sigma factor RsiW
MTCNEARALLSAFLDDEIDRERSLQIRNHLAACAACRSELAALREVSGVVRASATRFVAPPGLARAIAGRPAAAPSRSARTWCLARRHHLAMAAAILLAAVVAGALTFVEFGPPAGDALVRQAVAAYRQAETADRRTEITSADRTAIAAWAGGEGLGFAPPVADLGRAGYDLVGARRESVAGAPAVAVVYRRGNRFVDLVVVPAPGIPARHAQVSRHDDLAVVDWSESGLQFLAVSDLDSDALMRFHKAVEGAIQSP